MRLEQLYYFVEVAKYKSITVASEKIHITQPTISEAIKNLEKEIGDSLYIRNYHGIELTELGQKVVAIAQNILAQVEEINQLTDKKVEDKSSLSRSLVIYTIPTINQNIFIKVIPEFIERFPKIKLTVYEREIYDAISSVSELKGDFGIIAMHDDVFSQKSFKEFVQNGLKYEKLITVNMWAAIGKKSPLFNKKTISLKTVISSYPLVIHDYSNWENMISIYGSPNIVLKSSDIKLCTKMISEGQAIGFFSDYVWQNNNNFNKDLIKLLPVKERLNYSIYLIYQNELNAELYDIIQEFVKIIRKQPF